MSTAAARRVILSGIANKYKAKPTILALDSGEARFDSKHEATVYQKLAILERANRIRNLKRQVRLACLVNGAKVCDYVADFTFEEDTGGGNWAYVVADAKGYRTPMYRLKKKLVLACLGLEIREL